MSKFVFLSFFIAFAISCASGPFIIPVLRRIKCGQTVREDGPKSHLVKNGTPTMGGIMILLGVLLASVIFIPKYPEGIPVLIMVFGFGIIGFIDDYIKVVLKRSMGLRAWQKMLLQIVVTAVFAFYVYQHNPEFSMRIPFAGGMMWNAGTVLGIVILFFAVLGTVNGSNFTDGLDGLASSVTAVIAAFFAFIAVLNNHGSAMVALAFLGALLGFLVFNLHPAKVFMGDTGSLALGGFVVGMAYMLDMPIFIIIVAFIYFVEVLSVILQVNYFKLTGGKRIFKMAPIHHHFELCGWSETKVVGIFTIFTILFCILGYIAY